MSLNHHLVKVKGVCYYRARVPTRLVETLGPREIKYSLDTKDVTVARRLITVSPKTMKIVRSLPALDIREHHLNSN